MLRMLLFAGLLLPAVIAPAASAGSPVILVLGDSLSAAYGLATDQGWVALLQARLASANLDYRVVNASVSGDTTGGGLTRLPQALERHRPALVVIELGANDGLRGLPLREIEANLTALVQLARQDGTRVLLVGVRLPPNYGASYNQGFQAALDKVVKIEGVPLVPDLLAGVAEDWRLIQADGLHPTAEAQPKLLETVWPRLQPLLGSQAEKTEVHRSSTPNGAGSGDK